MTKLIAQENDRLDKFVAKETQMSRAQVQKLIKEGKILVEGKAEKANYLLQVGNEIEVLGENINSELDIKPEKMNLDIIYEDDDVVVINKPSGVVVHPAPGHYSGTLVNGLLYHFKNLSNLNGDLRPGIVHRIDKDTSGLLVVCKNNQAHQKLAQQLSDKTLSRKYLAIVHGQIQEDEAEIIAPIGRDKRDRKKMAVQASNSKDAQTNVFVKERFDNYTFVECELTTGRTHQIRVHLNYINYPIVGDPLYGPKKTIDTKGQALHAYKLAFIHPTTGKKMEFEVEPPEEFEKTLELVRG